VWRALEAAGITDYGVGTGVALDDYDEGDAIPDMPLWSLRIGFRGPGDLAAFRRCYRGPIAAQFRVLKE
jgi:hypothetical protein